MIWSKRKLYQLCKEEGEYYKTKNFFWRI